MARRDFIDFLTDIEEGQFHADLTNAMPELTRRCLENNLVGTLTITLKVKPRGNGRQVDIIPSFTAKAPVRKPDPSVFYVDDEGIATRNDPKQLPLRAVATKPPTKLRVAGAGAQAQADDDTDDKGGQN